MAAPVLDHPLTASGEAAARAAARVGLYVHVPFCAARCSYCAFASGALSAAAVERYLGAIEREAARRAPAAAGVHFSSVFFGGGTPSTLAPRHFARLARAVRDHFAFAPGAEWTLEANPESVRPALLAAWAAAGVNRLSLGAQSFIAGELARLGRIHDAARPRAAVALARAHGFRRLSLDLMFGYPGHTPAALTETVEHALTVDPGHLSAYCFIPEPGTPLGDAVLRREVELPSAEAQADLYEALVARLALAGYARYETSNFCRPGEQSRHNLVYWLRRDYLGLGPSAHGLWRGRRYANHDTLAEWAAALEAGAPGDRGETETAASRADETMMLALRLEGGLRAADYPAPAWRELLGRYRRPLAAARARGRLVAHRGGYRLAPQHAFVADDVIAWLMAAAERPDAFDGAAVGLLRSQPCPSPPSRAA